MSSEFEKMAKLATYLPEKVVERHDRAADIQWGVNCIGKGAPEVVHF